MEITASYLDWPSFSALAEGNFEERYWAHADDGDVPGEVPVDDPGKWSDSFFAWEDASDYLDTAVSPRSPWRAFVEQGFLAVIHGDPEPRNDLGEPVDPELFAAVFSPASVREIMEPTVGQPLPWSEASPEQTVNIAQWHTLWTRAMDRGLGIAYHLG